MTQKVVPTVFERLPPLNHDRWVMVGRLDINSTGLLLFYQWWWTGSPPNAPSNEIEREYAVRVMGEVTPEIILNLKRGVMLEDGMAQFDDIVEKKKAVKVSTNGTKSNSKKVAIVKCAAYLNRKA